ncbi:hypothetical protein GDO81_022554 [Engystomops pustulosus]|uniref:Lipocalin-like domain-containing protein n=1 Tax=Engystomops pustulosus TaxID=76066 RepID=A0AAV6Z5I3_ENGPU|nr:hypothetical protein GDO81_022554 [Engystomops pustulosus]
MLGNAMCSYVVSGIQYNNGAHNVLFNIIYNGGKIESPGSPTSIPPAPNTGYSMIFTTYMVSGGIGLTLNGLSVQITLDISQVKAGLPGTDPNANYHVEIKFTAVKDCKLQEGSGSVTVSLNVSLKASEKVIANVAANVKLDLRVEYKGGSMSLNVNVK